MHAIYLVSMGSSRPLCETLLTISSELSARHSTRRPDFARSSSSVNNKALNVIKIRSAAAQFLQIDADSNSRARSALSLSDADHERRNTRLGRFGAV